jgi:hypothetical protein
MPWPPHVPVAGPMSASVAGGQWDESLGTAGWNFRGAAVGRTPEGTVRCRRTRGAPTRPIKISLHPEGATDQSAQRTRRVGANLSAGLFGPVQ